jgi:hypothetical protein
MAKFKYLKTTATTQNYVDVDTEGKFNSENATAIQFRAFGLPFSSLNF